MRERTALEQLVRWQVRGPCEQYRYSECRYCHATWWDREQHNFDCIVPEARTELVKALRALWEATPVSDSPVGARGLVK